MVPPRVTGFRRGNRFKLGKGHRRANCRARPASHGSNLAFNFGLIEGFELGADERELVERLSPLVISRLDRTAIIPSM